MTDPWIAPDLGALLAKLPDVSVLALTLYGEASAEPIEGIVAVGNVIQHRVKDKRWPDTAKGVCLQPWQFSCWNPIGGASNYARMVKAATALAQGQTPEGADFEECAAVATMLKALRDRVKQANHYHVAAMNPRPKWAQKQIPVVQVAHHVFYKL